MQELIKIQKTEIGAEITNSDNARELHKQLEVKKDYSNWIKAQINRAGLEENKDYVVFAQKGENLSGGRPSSEYIITTEGAKHIAMISNTPRGKIVRDYFIECEKQYLNLRNNSDYTPVILELIKTNQEITKGLTTINQNMIELVTLIQNERQEIRAIKKCVTDRLPAIFDEIQYVSNDIYDIKESLESTTLDAHQHDELARKMKARAKLLANHYGIGLKETTSALWIKLNEHFNTTSYRWIKKSEFESAIKWVDSVDMKATR